ncbi:hypothetical protein ACM64Y_19800 [Novispirillum sp. DQ9]|uniref:hypothetical protein n=1 Tax=Novispirillum sp. DQ9 TaxID=3398612 RepID=UPI003C7DC3B1
MMRSAWKALAVAGAALFLLGACGSAAHTTTGLAAVEGVLIINTDKTVVDHFASMANDMDCSTIRAQQGGHYCMPRYENQPMVPALYCYRTLADVTCYDRPSTNAADRLVGVQPGGMLPTY